MLVCWLGRMEEKVLDDGADEGRMQKGKERRR
jgi:hypothetical protein